MKAKDKRMISDRCEIEGFDYAFAHYSSFPEIKDAQFHELREAFLAAREALVEYCGLEDV